MARIHAMAGRTARLLDGGWTLAVTEPGGVTGPEGLEGIEGVSWLTAPVPGTAAQALRAVGRWSPDQPTPLHDKDVWYRLDLDEAGPRTLRFHGLATLAEVWLNHERILTSDSMFLAHEVPVRLSGRDRLHLCFRALHTALAKKRGRARWRPRMVEPQSLRFVRTTLLGHMPGWCPPVHAVGPWRPVECIEEAGPLHVESADLRTGFDGRNGSLSLGLSVEWNGPARPPAFVEVAGRRAELEWMDARTLRGSLTIPEVEPWWPHSHGRPALHAVSANVGGVRVDLGRTGFRRIERDAGPDGRGFALRVNGERVFCRGTCWTTPDIVALPGGREAYEPGLRLMAEAGMNMVRVGGTMTYEADAFFDLCDELGILVWQDFMFANFEYPTDPAFQQSVRQEAAQLLDRTQASPSLAVLCGGSEAMQQAAMLGLPRPAWSQPLFDELLRAEVERARPDAVYVPNSPHGDPEWGDLPFAAHSGVTHYYGVGAYQRPLEDARRAGVRFAAECLAFANVPEAAALPPGAPPVHHPRWKEGVPRDVGASWDFEDVRDHYLKRLYGVEPAALRYEDPDRYLRLSRAVTGEVMEAAFAEWRRPGSGCGGALVWLFQDLRPGAGWGVVDAAGGPKAAWHALKRAFRLVHLALTDEGVNGLGIHLINETAQVIKATLSLSCLRHGELPVVRAERPVTLPPRGAFTLSSSALLDSFFDITHAYRFGPAPHDATVALLADAEGNRIAEAFHFPRGYPIAPVDLGLSAEALRDEEGWSLLVISRRLALSVHIEDDGYRAAEEWFHLAPGAERRVRLIPRNGNDISVRPDGELHALNATAPVRFRGSA
ncbi:glycoside hydrolase family 2 protein [Azospirillum sp. SYSU D00513]|uniref:glycoside hydrolase family 2 protein n=1 Tax=Azospirillum sp. SYSU D00513 TaxID=2812561 RepID=UPI001A96555A|nr:glycoside hydrolase family 2 protein [Azospirillum sp. SYSU D00513]